MQDKKDGFLTPTPDNPQSPQKIGTNLPNVAEALR